MNSSFESEVRGLYKNGIEIMYYMRGALSKEEMISLTAWERDMFVEFLRDRLDEEKKKAKYGPQPMVY
jgi:hypothetical protein